MRGLDGRIALVTGAGRGIGRCIADRLINEGVRVVINDVDDVAELAATELDGGSGRTVACRGDVRDPRATDAMVRAAMDAFGGLDIVVNNAGVTRDAMVHRMRDEDWDLVVDVSLRGAFNICRSAGGILREPDRNHHRKVVNIVSINGIYGTAANANYSAAKAGVIGLTKALAREWAPRRVNVNAVAPGFIAGTRLTAPRGKDDVLGIPPEVLEHIHRSVPIGRAGTGDDVAGVAAFLASSDSDYLTGQVIELHGGLEIIQMV